jgi:PiT family inorganic phosphate transporter
MIATRTMRERSALAFAAVLNVLGALLGIGLALGGAGWALRILDLADAGSVPLIESPFLPAILIGMVGAMLIWSVSTWALGMPSSTWQSLAGAAIGACLVLGQDVPVSELVIGVVFPLLLAPVLGSVLAYLVARVVRRLGQDGRVLNRHLEVLQTVSAGAVAAGHGLHDAVIPMAIVMLAGTYAGIDSGTVTWYALPVALAMGLGTLVGGRRIIRTLARRLTNLVTVQGFAAEASTAVVMMVGIGGFGVELSTTQTLTSSVVGAGLAEGPRYIRWKVFGWIGLTWLLTPLASALLAAVLTLLVHRLS